MGFIAWIVLGLLAGTIAKAIMGAGGSWVSSLVLGVLGSVIGGWLAGQFISGADARSFWSPVTWIVAIAGACLLLFLFGLFTRKKA